MTLHGIRLSEHRRKEKCLSLHASKTLQEIRCPLFLMPHQGAPTYSPAFSGSQGFFLGLRTTDLTLVFRLVWLRHQLLLNS